MTEPQITTSRQPGNEPDAAGYKRGERVTIACILGNVALTLLKLLAGLFGSSQAMISDALHSASDIIATTVVLIGIRISEKAGG